MSYLVLARKWRPRTFAEIVGQEHVIRALTNALESERLHHAYLFAGTRGVGKTTIARILAKALNCETGMTATPCGECGACLGIDEGRFVDLIEVDAASKTKVDDTRDLLDNVQFAPAGGRFKVYLIDEVHMLTKHSFNALLKTLEEPPPHVKFLLATTDPQKLPVTVLSRCLQFNLKRLTPRLIRDRLEFICGEEGVSAEEGALALIARAADGSVRDALSLLDQAIAFCAGELREPAVAEMLGTIDRQHVRKLLDLLASGDGKGLLAAIADIDQQFPDYAQMLDDLARLLQRIAVYKTVGASEHDDDLSDNELEDLAPRFSNEDLQLFYQISIAGRRDLPIAPDPRSGAEMTLLRMLAFRPDGIGRSVAPRTGGGKATAKTGGQQPVAKESTEGAAAEPAEPSVATSDAATSERPAWENVDWAALVPTLGLRGAEMLLASNCALLGRDGDTVRLSLDPGSDSYLTKPRVKSIEDALSRHFGQSLNVEMVCEKSAVETPMQQKARHADEAMDAARASLESDPNVRTLQDMFGATLNSDSIQIVDKQ